MNKEELIRLGSKTAKGGFKNEKDVIKKFNNWKKDKVAQEWLIVMGYEIGDIEYVKAAKIKGSFKADIQVQIQISIKLKFQLDVQNLQVKLVSNPRGFNQIDKRWIDNYIEMWKIPADVANLLKCFTGETCPEVKNLRDKRRMFLDEFSETDRNTLLDFFNKNKTLIISDILKGRGKFAAEWFLVILKIGKDEAKWALKPINFVLNHYGNGEVSISPRGSINIGRVLVQRKGGDNGRKSACMLQFKINPAEIFET